ncbi:lantibiotic dehydratase [Lysinibacillus sp. NPDC056232]|uniref:lantibiotic dehydratase n=1 Tax=Lysinibacillus sp. NPDC056232 TaxID=3345756 RepID=UPI0035DB1618
MATINTSEISDLVLARVSVNPVSMLEKFIFKESKEVLENIYALKKEIEDMKTTVIDCIFSVVPYIEDKKLSGKLIRLKRGLYNNKPVNLESIKSIINDIPEKGNYKKSIFQQWLEKEVKLQSEIDRLGKLYQKEVQQNEEELWGIFNQDKSEFMRGMPIVNSGFSDFLNSRKQKHYQLDSNYFKSVYSYFLRSVAKTSPISTFTQLTLSGFAPKTRDFQVNGVYVRWLRGLVSNFFESLSIKQHYVHFFRFKVTDFIETEDKGRIYFRGNYSAINSIFSKTEDVFIYNEFLNILQSLPLHSFTYDQLVAEINHPYPERIAKFLIEQKLIRPIMPCSLQDNMPFKAIANFMKESKHFDLKVHGDLCEKLFLLDNLKAELEITTSKSKRDFLVRRIKDNVEIIYQLIQTTPPYWISTTELVYEDTRFKTEVPFLGENLKNEMIQLQEYIKPFTYRHALNDRLMDKFIQFYGKSGNVTVLEFLCEIIESEMEYSKLIKLARHDDIQNVMSGKNIYEDNQNHKSATLYYQIVSESHENLLNGDYLIVINKVTDGSGSVFSRFNPMFDEKHYKEEIVQWNNKLSKSQEIVEFSVGGDWANVQEKYNLFPNQLNWIGELPNVHDEENTKIGVTDLNLSIRDGKFILTDKENHQIKPVYLGAVPEHLSADLSKLFFTIVKPWYIRTPYGSNPLNKPQVNENDNITHIPRFQEGKIVFEREKWVVKLEELQGILSQYKDNELFLELNTWRRKHNIPEEVFFTLESNSMLDNYKPMWFHFLSIPCINLLKRSITSKSNYITFTEALPSVNSQWYKDKEEKYVTEFMSLLSI